MNVLDAAVLAIVLLSALFAYARGFVREVFSVIAWAGALAATYYGSGDIARVLTPVVSTPLLGQLIAVAALFLGSLIALTIVGWRLCRLIQSQPPSAVDRTLGFLFGIGRGLALVVLAFIVLNYMLPATDWPPIAREARSRPFLSAAADTLRPYLPALPGPASAGPAEPAGDAAHATGQSRPTMPARLGNNPAPANTASRPD